MLKVASTGTVTTVAGTGTCGTYLGDGGPATQAQLCGPTDVAIASDGTLYIADFYNNRVRKVSPSGTITTVAGTGVAGFSGDGGSATAAKLNAPAAVAVASKTLYIGDAGNHRIRKVSPNGTITTVVGTGVAGSIGDGGAPTAAEIDVPTGLAFDQVGDLYIVDQQQGGEAIGVFAAMPLGFPASSHRLRNSPASKPLSSMLVKPSPWTPPRAM